MAKKKIKLDKFHYHEMLDRLFMVADIVADHIYEHPVVEQHPELQAFLDEAGDNLMHAYTLAAQLADKHDKGKKKR